MVLGHFYDYDGSKWRVKNVVYNNAREVMESGAVKISAAFYPYFVPHNATSGLFWQRIGF